MKVQHFFAILFFSCCAYAAQHTFIAPYLKKEVSTAAEKKYSGYPPAKPVAATISQVSSPALSSAAPEARTPEQPPTDVHTPNSIQKIHLADPAEEITTIDAPVANSMGSAALGYPLKLPAGRNGMEPELSIRYNSEGGNGWLGMDWNLSLEAIMVETRWGVPRYDASMETETYSINGEQLSPVAHREEAVSRTAEKQFYPRVESDFAKIIRHGSSPSDYWWEVTDKSGTRKCYGGTLAGGTDPGAALKDVNGNIAFWALTETRDAYGNFVRYRYTKVTDPGISGGSDGSDIYPASITYTGYGTTEGKYCIEFIRDRQLGEPVRPDVSISGRWGLKQVTADLLRKINVKYNGQNIRSYQLNYTTGEFYKTLLQSISEFDAAGTLFNTHSFEYYNDVNNGGSFHPLTATENWSASSDNIKAGFLNPIPIFHDKASLISGNRSFGGGFGMAITIGPFDGNLAMKTNTAGVTFGFNYTKNEGMLALVDINGDGLPDKVYKKGGSLFFRPNQSGPGGSSAFGPPQPIIGISDFSKGETFTDDVGLESHFVVFAGFEYTRTEDITSAYFSDVNADGLVDIVKDGKVYFNHIDASGNPSFTLSSGDTPSPINGSSSVDPNLVENDPQTLETAIDDNPLHDVIKMWQAPFDGTIRITAPVALLMDTSADAQAYTAADGIRVAIQHKGNELWSADIPANDFTPKTPAGVNAITVHKGDRIYFRVQSKFNGAYDQVLWSPEITYTDKPTGLTDANNLPVYQFRSGDDFLVSSNISTGMTIGGQIIISGDFVKPVTSDDITIRILKKSNNLFIPLLQQSFTGSQVTTFPISITHDVLRGDALYFSVSSNTNIDWAALKWNPFVYFNSTTDTCVTQLFDEQHNPMVTAHPVVYFDSYNTTAFPSLSWQAPVTDTFAFKPSPVFHFNFEAGDLVFTIKKQNQLISKQVLPVVFGTVIGTPRTDTLILNAGDKLFFEYHTENVKLAGAIDTPKVIVSSNPGGTNIFTGGLHTKDESLIFGPLYRHWGQFAYNGNRTRAGIPIIESDLKLDESLNTSNPPSIDLSTAANADDMQNMYDAAGGNKPKEDKFIMLVPDNKNKLWIGYDNLTYVKKDTISSSRMGKDDLQPVNPISNPSPGTGGSAVGINKVSNSNNFSLAVGIGPAGLSASFGDTKFAYDFSDMNGDGYPDILSASKIQYTRPFGGLESAARNFSFGDVDQSQHFSAGFTLGGTFLKSGAPNSKATPKGAKAAKASSQSETSLGISGSFNYNRDSTAFSWMDMNGDNLPDRVYKNGNVELNLGYTFLPAENWGFAGIMEGTALSYGAGLGINISDNSISAGFGLSRSENQADKTLQDMNGDGLPDYVIKGNPLRVALNKGNGFAPYTDWSGADGIRNSVSTGESINGAFTIGIPIIPIVPVVKLCINPSFNIAQGADRTTVHFEDIDGDGVPDFLRSDADNQVSVSRSTINRTNKLRKVNRPLKGNFTIDYKRIGNTYAMPTSIWAMVSVDVYDGVPGDGADHIRNSFSYENGRFDRNEREFYGFAKVTTCNLDTDNGDVVYRKTEEEYINDNFYEKGLLKTRTVKNGAGNLFTQARFTYELKDIHSGATLPAAFKQSDDGAAFPALTATQDLFYEGQATAGKTTSSSFAYDILGNRISATDFGDPGAGDDLTELTSYHSVPAKYIMNVPASVTTTGNGQIYRQSATTIDNNTGDVTESRQYLQSGDVAKTSFEYDVYGNVIKTTRPENATGQRLSYACQYDDEVKTYKTKTTDSYGYTSSATYDVRFGQLLSATDMNGQKTLYTFDNAGRISSITNPMEVAAGVPFTVTYAYHPGDAVPWAAVKQYDPSNPSNFIETATFCDGLKRVIQTKKDGAIFTGAQSPDQEMMLVSGDDKFDAFGRTVSTTYPTTEAKGTTGTMNTVADAVPPIRKTYDILDRPLTVTLPDGAVTTMTYDFGTDNSGAAQFKIKTTDANGISKENYTNVRSLLKATKEQYRQGSDVWTSYDYNPVDELVKVTDDRGNSIISSYDRMGRRISVQHPDAGLTTYQYDLNGNPIRERTANLQNGAGIQYTYDQERLIKVIYPQNPSNNVTLTYGAPGAASFGAGRLIKQQDGSGTQEYSYNPQGAIVKNKRVINVPDATALTYTTEWTYDTWNRLTGMLYPDGEKLTYSYNLGGRLEKMSGVKNGTTYNYLPKTGYDKFEERVYLRYGNGTEHTYSFETARRRLQGMTARTAATRLIMDNTYTYDREDNILGIANNAPVPPSNLMGGRSSYQYTYDDLYRLTGAGGTFGGSNHEQRYSTVITYDNLYNITGKTQLHERKATNSSNWVRQSKTSYSYQYNFTAGSRPHTPAHIGDKAYTYDANGNQTGWQHDVSAQNRAMVWDEENRIKTLSDNGQTFNYTYDASGQRVLKSNGQGQSVNINGKSAAQSGGIGNYNVYVNPYLDVRSGGFTKHFYIDEGRIASKLGDNGKGNGNGNGNNLESFQFYYHKDHLSNTAFITDRLGEVYQHLEYFPFGEIFVDEHGNQERTPYLYNGKELDEETDLSYYGARYFDARTSLWPSVDPGWELPDEVSKSPYAFVVNNPIRFSDLDGRGKHKKPDWLVVPDGYFWSSSTGKLVKGKKRGPKVDGEDDAHHGKTIKKLKGLLEDAGYEHLGGDDLVEEVIPTPDGEKPYRRVDLTMRKGKRKYYFQVGRITKREELPVPREVEALDDLASVGVKAVFVPYGYITRTKAEGERLNVVKLTPTIFKKFKAGSGRFHAGKDLSWRRGSL